MRDNDFRAVLARWMVQEIPQAFDREINVPLDIGKIISIVGPRRAGKTYLMFILIKKLAKRLKKDNILYVNFEDERLRNLDARDLETMIKIYYELFKPEDKPVYLFLDEIQNVKDWDKWVRRIHDQGNYRLYLSGSSSKLLSREISTSLRGRNVDVVVFQLSFREFIKIKGVNFKKGLLEYLEEERGKILRYIREYIEFGSFPEVVMEDERIKEKILNSYYNAIFYRDLVERFRIRNMSVFEEFTKYCLSNHAKYLSISKAHRYLKSLGFKVGKAKLLDYIKYYSEIFFIFHLEIFSYSIKDRKQYPKKIYVVDNGLIRISGVDTSISRLMENTVFMEILRRSEIFNKFQVFYWKEYGKAEGREVDFVLKEGTKIRELIQVTYASTREDVREREVNSLIKASKELKAKKLVVITWDYEGTEEINNRRIEFVPLWKWLLE